MAKNCPTVEEITAVANRLEQTYHSVTALHELCCMRIAKAKYDEDIWDVIILRETLRGIARDMENCTETLNGDPGGIGYFSSNYGKV